MKLCLGTVQFGMNYGVFDTPKKDEKYCISCMDFATQNGIDAIDTAAAYGTAEEIVGKFLAKKTISREKLFISTKLTPNIMDDISPDKFVATIRGELQKSLSVLNTDYVDAYYFHSSRYAYNSELLDAIAQMEKEGLARRTGVSVYYPEEAKSFFANRRDDIDTSCIQAPYSLFDHRMRETGVLEECQRGFGIDVRTVFIKGLIKLREDEVPQHLSKARPILGKLDKMCKNTGYSRIDLALGYIKREKVVNHLVFGIRTIEQLREDIKSFDKSIPNEIFEEIEREFSGIDADIVVPSLWVKR